MYFFLPMAEPPTGFATAVGVTSSRLKSINYRLPMNNYEKNQPMKPGAGQTNFHHRLKRAYCKKDLIKLYGVTYKTLAGWLKPMASEIGPLHGNYFTTAQLEIIFDTLGYPGE